MTRAAAAAKTALGSRPRRATKHLAASRKTRKRKPTKVKISIKGTPKGVMNAAKKIMTPQLGLNAGNSV